MGTTLCRADGADPFRYDINHKKEVTGSLWLGYACCRECLGGCNRSSTPGIEKRDICLEAVFCTRKRVSPRATFII